MIIERIDLPEYKKILNDPEAELEALAKRIIPWLEDSQHITNHAMYCFVMMAWSQLGRLAEELAISKSMAQDKDPCQAMRKYYEDTYHGKKSAAMICIRAIRESMDALDAVKPELMSAEKQLRLEIAERIRAELVCCDSADKADALYDKENMGPYREFKRSPDYHGICQHAEWAARIAQGNE